MEEKMVYGGYQREKPTPFMRLPAKKKIERMVFGAILGTPLFCFFSGFGYWGARLCMEDLAMQKAARARKNIVLETVVGNPLSIQSSARNEFSTVLEKEGNYVLCQSRFHGTGGDCSSISHALALIESEMRDGDSEPIKLRGYMEKDKFLIKSVTANGHTIDLRNYDEPKD